MRITRVLALQRSEATGLVGASAFFRETRKTKCLLPPSAQGCFRSSSGDIGDTAASAQDPDPVVLGRSKWRRKATRGLVQDGYVPVSGRIGSSETPFVEVPQSVSVITERQLDDRNPATLEEALGYVPGVRLGAYGLDPRSDAFWIRGFDATYNGIFQDNLRRFAAPTGIFRSEPYGLEAVEILKGPSSSLYGASTAGGLVNLVTKKPTEQPFRELELQVGSHERKQANLDLSGPANEKGTLLYRLTGVLRDSETQIDDYPDNRAYIAPAVTWKPSEDTTLTILGEYMDSKVGSTAHYVGGPDPESVTNEPEADPNFNDFTQEQYRIGYEFSHRFNDTFSFFSAARYAGLKTTRSTRPGPITATTSHNWIRSQPTTSCRRTTIAGRSAPFDPRFCLFVGRLRRGWYPGQHALAGERRIRFSLNTRNSTSMASTPPTGSTTRTGS